MEHSRRLYEKKKSYEEFTRSAVSSDYFQSLDKNNKAYRHVLRFLLNVAIFIGLVLGMYYLYMVSSVVALICYPLYLYIQSLLIAGFMIHSHELSHNQVKYKSLNDLLGIITGILSWINFYSFQSAHRLHHKNIGNMDEIEAGAPISAKGQKKIRDEDKLHKTGLRIFNIFIPLWFFISWPLFLYYGDYNSWLLPVKDKTGIITKSLVVFVVFLLLNGFVMISYPLYYIGLYLCPLLIGGNRVLVITSMHHAHEDTMFFNEKEHNFYNIIMSTTDRKFGPLVNFFMLNNGYHIAHHMNTKIAYYDLKNASAYLRETIPDDLAYNYYPHSRFYRDFMGSYYEKRLDKDYQYYQIKYL